MGERALAQRWAILPGVSAPSSVVRSIIVTASLSPATFASVFKLRVVKLRALSSTMIWSTGGAVNREGREMVGAGEGMKMITEVLGQERLVQERERERQEMEQEPLERESLV